MSTQMQTCSLCGSQVPVDSRFCQNCGHAMTQESSTARVENITPPQGSPTVNVGQQYAPGNTQYPPQAPTQSWQPSQQAEAPRQPQYAPP
ncbi:MAG: zinc-ribbon domain-containing protein, partial [Chloroflexota bacterium]|nr:zinc-ribbon domain-containing protein [Chloroflexota bacterium]